jgi:enoyl-CoA hydratase/carnithine racemase
MSDPVLLETRDEGLLHLELNRPEKRNALSAELRGRIVEALDMAATDEAVKVVLISGVGDHFCAGFDLNELAGAEDPASVFADAELYHRRVHTFAKPIVAAVAGSAVAGGLDLALMCDVRVASTAAKFGQPQVRHGIPAAYELLATAVGDAPARELCLTGRVVAADEAHRMGLVARVVAPEDLIAAGRQVATDIASVPAAAAMKQRFIAAQPNLFASS